MRIHNIGLSSAFAGWTQALLAKYTNLEEYIRATNPAPNGSKDLSKVRTGDIIVLEGSPCKISRLVSTGKTTLVEGIGLIDDIPYASRFNHCYGVTVSTFSGRPLLLQCLVYRIRESTKCTFVELAFNRDSEITFEMKLPDSELGKSACRQFEYTLRRPRLRAFVLVSCWGEERKVVGFRLNTERAWHVAPRSSHWCEDCVASYGGRLV